MKKEFFSVKKIAILGMLLALNVVLAKFSIHTLTVKVGFAFIALVISAMMYGPVEAGIVGALGDVLGYVINPVGAFFPGFTITAFLTGLVYGFFLKKNVTIFKAIGAAGVVQFVIGLICNTYYFDGAGIYSNAPRKSFTGGCVIYVTDSYYCINRQALDATS